jgi:hypothetical protein
MFSFLLDLLSPFPLSFFLGGAIFAEPKSRQRFGFLTTTSLQETFSNMSMTIYERAKMSTSVSNAGEVLDDTYVPRNQNDQFGPMNCQSLLGRLEPRPNPSTMYLRV